MTIREIVSNNEELNEEAVIYAKRIDGKFLSSSEAVLIELSEEDQDLSTKEIADKYCPGFDYFLEVFLVKDMVQDLNKSVGYKSLGQQIDRIIYYAEFDAWWIDLLLQMLLTSSFKNQGFRTTTKHFIFIQQKNTSEAA